MNPVVLNEYKYLIERANREGKSELATKLQSYLDSKLPLLWSDSKDMTEINDFS